MNDGCCVTIPTKNDLTISEYGFSNATVDRNRLAEATSGEWNDQLYIDGRTGCSAYFTRSEVGDQSVTIVRAEGKFGSVRITCNDVGIRPMIYIDPRKLDYVEGAGSIEQPYNVAVK